MIKVGIYGDSILRGVTLDEQTKKYVIDDCIGFDSLASRYGLEVDNYSKFGFTVEKGMRLVARNAEMGKKCDYALVEYGGNDSDFDWAKVAAAPREEHLSNTPLEKFRSVYRQLIQTLKEQGTVPVLATLPPVDAEKYLRWICRNGLNRESILTWLGDVFRIFRFQEGYSRQVKALAEEMNCPVLDLRTPFLKKGLSGLFCSDGIHPSVEGQKLIHQTIAEFLTGQGRKLQYS